MITKHNYVWISFLGILLATLLASCGIATLPESTVSVDTPVASKTVVNQPPSSATEESAQQEIPTIEIIFDSPTALPPTPRSGLEASDPVSFVQASGQVQLVEFFAFW